MRDAKEAFRNAWAAALNLHSLFVRVFRNPCSGRRLILAAFSDVPPPAHFSQTLPFWSKVDVLTITNVQASIQPVTLRRCP